MQRNYAENDAPIRSGPSEAPATSELAQGGDDSWGADSGGADSREQASREHASVMTQEVVEIFAPLGEGLVLDATFGRGGHSRALLTQTSCRVFAIDCDHEAIAYAHANPFFRKRTERFSIAQGFFASASELLAAHDIYALDGVLFDYGISSAQLDNPERGFSFQRKGPLDMRMAQQGANARESMQESVGESAGESTGESAGESALEFLQNVSEETLAEQFRLCGEPQARKLAKTLVAARQQGCLPQDTQELAELVRKTTRRTNSRARRKNISSRHNAAAKGARNKKDAATLAFMAIRIAVNNELEQIAEGLRQADSLLKDKGRIAAISFHSLEDRIVKRQFYLWTGRRLDEQSTSRYRASMRDIELIEPEPIEPETIDSGGLEPIGRDFKIAGYRQKDGDGLARAKKSLKQKTPEVARYRSLLSRLQRPQAGEIVENPRARSAKLRAVEKCLVNQHSHPHSNPHSNPHSHTLANTFGENDRSSQTSQRTGLVAR